MRNVYLLLLLSCLGAVARAQTAASYIFTRTTSTYNDISTTSGVTSFTSMSSDDTYTSSIPIGFTFKYCGTNYTQLSACSNGWMSLANGASSTLGNTSLSNAPSSANGFIMPIWDDLNGASRTAYRITTGSAPNRVFILQWGNNSLGWGSWTGSGNATFQVRLYETSNIVELCYGTSSYAGKSATIGIANSTSDYQVLTSPTSSTTNSSSFSSYTSLNTTPAANTVLRFVPPPELNVTPASVSFGAVTTGTSSGAQVVSMVGQNLNPTSGSLTITAPSGFQVSSNGTTWSTSYTAAYTGGLMPATNIYIRFNPTATTSYSGNVTISGGGLSPVKNIPVSGVGAALCSGMPTAGTASISPTSGMASTAFTLSLTGTTVAGGLTFQWQSSATGTSGWTNISGATNATFNFTGITATTHYRCLVSCGSNTATSGSATATFLVLPTCVTTSASWTGQSGSGNYGINVFSITGYSGSTLSDAGIVAASSSTTGYLNRMSLPPVNLRQGDVYPASGTWGTIGGNQFMGVWIDFNDNGTYEPSEFVSPVAGNVGGTMPQPTTFNITIPITANAGTHLMRMRGIWQTNATSTGSLPPALHPCNINNGYNPNYYSGTCVDYVVNIIPLIPPAPSISGSTDYCYGSTIALTASSTATSPTFTWSGPGGFSATGASISIPSASPATAGAYSCYVTSFGIPGPSTVTNVVVNPVPAAITGIASVCESVSMTLNNASPGGSWSSATPSIATATGTGGTGTITGAAAGTVVVSYSFPSTGCAATKVVTVYPTPVATTGVALVCEAGTTTLSHPDGGTGTWSSATPATATVGLTSGIVTGITSGYGTISYTDVNGCVRTRQVTVNPLPDVMVTPASAALCLGESATFTASSDAPQINLLTENFNGTLGGWTITTGAGVPAANAWQLVSPPGTTGLTVNGDGSQYLQASSSGYGGFTTTTIESPSFQTLGGFASVTLTFNQSLLSFNPDIAASVEYSVNGGAWTELTNQVTGPVVVVNDGGTWDAASPEFTMALPAAAIGQSDVRIRFVYNAQSLYWSLDNVSVKGTLPASTFSWGASPALSCTNCAATTITPATSGTTIYNVATTTSAGCVRNTPVSVTVNPLPAAVTSGLLVCEGVTNMLTSTPGGVWTSGTPSVATVGSFTGALTGVAAGTTDITYTLSATGCRTMATATVLPAPASITPASVQICTGATVTLGNTDAGGTWSSGNTSVATVNTSGVVSGIVPGIVPITYTIPSGCIAVREVTVNPLPSGITGSSVVCENGTTILNNSDLGGTWSSANDAIASVNSVSGEVTGNMAGNTIISYILPGGCNAIKGMQVNPAPAAITGPSIMCQGATSVFTTSSTGGTWSSTAPVIASVNLSGVVTTSSSLSGNVNIIYTFSSTGCSRAHAVEVSTRAVISGTASVCKGYSTTLTADIAGGTWASSNDLIATIDAGGVVMGHNVGNVTISYTSPEGCVSTRVLNVKPLPLAILGADLVCEGTSTHMINMTGGIGIWGSSHTSVATINEEGLVTAVTTAGTTTISYTSLSTGCMTAKTITVSPLPAAIIGNASVCAGAVMMVGNATPGGTWSSQYPSVASIDASGVVSGHVEGTTTVTYMLPTGCMQTHPVAVNPLPSSSVGAASVCEGQQTTFSNPTPGGTWSTSSTLTAYVDAMTGVVTGADAGTVNVIYSLPTGCSRSRSLVVNDMPSAIIGGLSVCPGTTTMLSSMPVNGVWSTGTASVATISASGELTGNSAGITDVTYTLPGGCYMTAAVTVNPLPDVISGTRSTCPGSTTLLTNTSAGGTWTTASSAVADVNASGAVTGNSVGVTAVTYTLPTGCMRSAEVTVNPLPSVITGPASVCNGSSITLTNATPGGSWTSANTSIATISPAGVLNGLSVGAVNISFMLPTGCMSTTAIEVYGLPADISGSSAVCEGSQIALSNSTTGGVWSSSNAAVASVDAAGMVSGVQPGTAMVRYTESATGCYKEKNVVVNAVPAGITGNTQVCQSSMSMLSSATTGGVWSSSNTTVAQVNASGNVTGVSTGFSVISYTLPTGCGRAATVVVNALPEPVTGLLNVCTGSSTQLESVTPGGVWSSSSSSATVNGAGLVNGLATGTSQIAYTNSNGCKRVVTVTVNALPGLIGGTATVCPGLSTMFTNVTPGGIWSSSNSSLASVNSTSGVITATGSDGVADITYTLSTGCMRSRQVTVYPSVSPVSGVSAICKGDMTTFSTASTGGMWMSGNTLIATVNASGVVNGVQAGNTSIAYVMPNGCKSETGVVINPLPASINGPAAVCEGATAVLTSATPGGAWSSSDGAIATIGVGGTVMGVTPGEVVITYSLPTGCKVSRTFAVNSLPAVMNVTGGGSYCIGGNGVTIGVDGSEIATQYRLVKGGSVVQTIQGIGTGFDFARQTSAGTYMVTATSPAGCVRSMNGSAEVSINPLVTVSVNVSSDMGDRVCNGSSVTYTANGVNGGTAPVYDWKVNGTSVAATPTYNYVPADGDVVSVAYTSSEACPVNATVNGAMTMEVLANLTPSVSITATTGDTLCEGSTAVFAATAVNGGDAAMYTWMVNGGIVSGVNGAGYSYVPADNDVVKVMLNSSYACVTENDVNSNSVTMQVDEIYVPIVELTVSPGLVVAEGTAVTFTANAIKAGTAPTYQWLVNGNVVNGATQPTYTTAKLNNGDSVTCVVMATDRCNNTSINSVVMTVTPATGVVMTGLSQSELRLIPNPNTGVFRVTGTLGVQTEEEVQLEVTNMLGQVVYHGVAKSRGGVLDAGIELGNNLANGMYMLNLTVGADHKAFHFVVKQ